MLAQGISTAKAIVLSVIMTLVMCAGAISSAKAETQYGNVYVNYSLDYFGLDGYKGGSTYTVQSVFKPEVGTSVIETIRAIKPYTKITRNKDAIGTYYSLRRMKRMHVLEGWITSTIYSCEDEIYWPGQSAPCSEALQVYATTTVRWNGKGQISEIDGPEILSSLYVRLEDPLGAHYDVPACSPKSGCKGGVPSSSPKV